MIYLTARDVHKSYGDHHVLKGASLELYQGEILALLGPNGSGKTTLIKILATLLTKDSGDVTILGYSLSKQENTIRHLFGYVGQDTDRSAYPRLTVKENLHFFGSLHGLSKKQVDAQIDKLVHYFDFHDSLNKWFAYLSGGQKQTTVIMRALLHDPPIVYLDEPTKGLDPIVAKRIRNFLVQYVKEEKKALLLTSHILTEVDEMASRISLIHAGVIPVTSTSAALKGAIGAETFVELQEEAISPTIKEEILQSDFVLLCLEREPGWISFGITNVFDGTEAIIRILRSHNVKTLLRHHSVSLEDAYVHHIGSMAEKFEK